MTTPTGGRTLLVTNDFPPRLGGIQSYLHGMVRGLPPASVVVYASSWPGAATFDAEQPFPVVRDPTRLLLPTPRVARRARQIADAERCTNIWFGAAAPLGLLAPGLRAAGMHRLVATTHGHEVGWAGLPVARGLLRRIASSVDTLTCLGEYTRRRLAGALGRCADRLVVLPFGVDTTRFHPNVDGTAVRHRWGLTDRPVVVCVSRLVPRKGQDTLLAALPGIRRRVPDAALLLVGGGPAEPRLRRLADSLGVTAATVFTGPVPDRELPAHYRAGDVFAMPCRDRWAGLEVEGLGVVYLEAAASGLPVVAGASGGAPEAVVDGLTGRVVDSRSVDQVAGAVGRLLADPVTAGEMGRRGREWMQRDWAWPLLTARLHRLLTGPVS